MSGSHTTQGCREKPPPELHSELLQLELQSSHRGQLDHALKSFLTFPFEGLFWSRSRCPQLRGDHTGRAGGHSPAPSVEMKACGFRDICTHRRGGRDLLFQFRWWWRCDSQSSVQVNFVQGSVLTHIQRRYQGVGPTASWFLPHKIYLGLKPITSVYVSC